jgi:hypothetical protein
LNRGFKSIIATGRYLLAITASLSLTSGASLADGATVEEYPRAVAQCGEWSKYPACEQQFIRDRRICQKVKSSACWASQMQRLAYCNRTKGQTGFPELTTR